MTETAEAHPTTRPRSPYVRAAAPAVASVGVLVWWIGLMGLVDLTVPLVPLEDFYDAYLVEVGWGLLYTVLLGVPTLVLAFRPLSDVAAQQLLTAALALGFAGLAAPEPGHLVPAAIGLGLVVAVRSMAGGRALPPSPHRRLTRRDAPGLVVVLAGLLPAIAYARASIDAFRDPTVPADVTQNLDHWPAQAAFGLATVLVAGVAVLAVRGRLLPALAAAASAVWFGVTSVAFPDHDGSLGTTGGRLAVAWGIALLAAVAMRRRPVVEPAGADGGADAGSGPTPSATPAPSVEDRPGGEQ